MRRPSRYELRAGHSKWILRVVPVERHDEIGTVRGHALIGQLKSESTRQPAPGGARDTSKRPVARQRRGDEKRVRCIGFLEALNKLADLFRVVVPHINQ